MGSIFSVMWIPCMLRLCRLVLEISPNLRFVLWLCWRSQHLCQLQFYSRYFEQYIEGRALSRKQCERRLRWSTEMLLCGSHVSTVFALWSVCAGEATTCMKFLNDLCLSYCLFLIGHLLICVGGRSRSTTRPTNAGSTGLECGVDLRQMHQSSTQDKNESFISMIPGSLSLLNSYCAQDVANRQHALFHKAHGRRVKIEAEVPAAAATQLNPLHHRRDKRIMYPAVETFWIEGGVKHNNIPNHNSGPPDFK